MYNTFKIQQLIQSVSFCSCLPVRPFRYYQPLGLDPRRLSPCWNPQTRTTRGHSSSRDTAQAHHLHHVYDVGRATPWCNLEAARGVCIYVCACLRVLEDVRGCIMLCVCEF